MITIENIDDIGFNGATTFQPWIAGRQIWETDSLGQARFNGATTFQPWIGERTTAKQVGSSTFQWGHDFSAMDSYDFTSNFIVMAYVSMGPRLFSHG